MGVVSDIAKTSPQPEFLNIHDVSREQKRSAAEVVLSKKKVKESQVRSTDAAMALFKSLGGQFSFKVGWVGGKEWCEASPRSLMRDGSWLGPGGLQRLGRNITRLVTSQIDKTKITVVLD